MKNKIFPTILKGMVLGISIAILVVGVKSFLNDKGDKIDDGINQVDLNTIYLEDSGVEVKFSDVILSDHEMVKKLMVTKQSAYADAELTDRMIEAIDWGIMKKSQTVSYTGDGYFVVDLEKLTKDSIIDDKENKVLTIKIPHPSLEVLEIDPNRIEISETKKGLLAFGGIKLTVEEYNTIEKELRNKLTAKMNTPENVQSADDAALEQVKDVYEPIIAAIDRDYKVEVCY